LTGVNRRRGAGTTIPSPMGEATDTYESHFDEHARCMSAVEAVQACIDRRPDDLRAWADELEERLDAMIGVLERHFEAEEHSYLFEDLPVRYTRFADTVERLKTEHGALLDALASARAATPALADPDDSQRLRRRLRALLATLRRHEAEEVEVLLGAHWDDLGAGD